jgi:hypothetical protein
MKTKKRNRTSELGFRRGRKLPRTACVVNLLGCEPPRYEQSEPGGESERGESCRAGGKGGAPGVGGKRALPVWPSCFWETCLARADVSFSWSPPWPSAVTV